MYSYIKGKIKDIKPSHIVLENNNIGYLIIVPNSYIYKLDDDITIYTHHYVREDIISLYGFNSNDAKNLFLKLITVSGVGPKTALSIMATDDINSVILAIENNDAKFLTKFPGIGTKTSQQIILDLKGKLVTSDDYTSISNYNDVKEALLALGYKNTQVVKTITKLTPGLKTEDALKEALKLILGA